MNNQNLLKVPPSEEITRAEVIEEEFPFPNAHIPTYFGKIHKKFYRFQFFYGKNFPEFSSGRFRSEENAEKEMYNFLKGKVCKFWGDVRKRGNRFE